MYQKSGNVGVISLLHAKFTSLEMVYKVAFPIKY